MATSYADRPLDSRSINDAERFGAAQASAVSWGAIFAGAAMQLPAGRMSDRMDRRYVLAILSGIAFLAGIQMFLVEPNNVITVLVLTGVYGATANALYPIAVAHANDFAKPSEFLNVSGGLLLLYTSLGNAEGMDKLARRAQATGRRTTWRHRE